MSERPDDEQGTRLEWNKFAKIEEELENAREKVHAALKPATKQEPTLFGDQQ